MTKIEQVVDLYKKFDMYESISDSFIIDNGKQPMRQVKVSDIDIFEDRLEINVDKSMRNYLRNIVSPVVKNKNEEGVMEDINKLHLALAVVKIYFEEKDIWYYLPLVTIDLTDRKNNIFNGEKIVLNSEDEVIVNDTLLNVLQSNKFLDNDQEKTEYTIGTIGDLIANSHAEMINELYSLFNFSDEFVLRTPKVVNNTSALFMFFNLKNNIKLRREYDVIKENPSSLVKTYLTREEDEVDNQHLDKNIWLGSLTKDYPLGEGQAIVMQKNAKNEKLLAVAGGPGTGKTTLFLSLIAQEVTKRAINIADNKPDKSNLMLVTSTSNKAVENVYSSLQHGFKTGFVYVGGNKINKTESVPKVYEYMEHIRNLDFNQEKYENAKKQVLHYIEIFKEKERIFNAVKGMNLGISKYEDLEFWLNNNFEKPTRINPQVIYQYSKILSVKNVLPYLKNILKSEKLLYFKDECNAGFLSRLFSNKNALVEEFNSNFGTNVSDITELKKFFNMLPDLSVPEVENFIYNEKILNVKHTIDLLEGKEKFFNGIMKYDSFSEYFRTNLFGMNYSLYIESLKLMEQEVLKNKADVLKACQYLVEDNGYKYLMDNYGFSNEKHKEFLKFLSMAFPVMTSTLAAISSMLPGVKVSKFNKVLADEAGMISVHHILPTLQVAKSAIIVGDVKQLEAITNVQEVFLSSLKKNYDKSFWDMYAPNQISAYHRSAGTREGGFKVNGCGIILDEHRRCAPKIANLFIDIAEYKNLKVCTKKPHNKSFDKIGDELLFFNVKNSNTTSTVKINRDEIIKIQKILTRLSAIGYNLQNDVGIITPYRQQEKALIDSFGTVLGHGPEAKIGTVHKFQGAEFKVIIFSSVVSRDIDNLNFVNNSVSMMNVALSRAKQVFIMVGDYERLTKVKSYDNFIGRVAQFIEKNGKFIKG